MSISLDFVIISLTLFDCHILYFSYVWIEEFESLLSLYFWPLTRKNASEVDNYYNEDFVKQHNLLRDLAIHLSSRDSIIERKRLIVDISGNNIPEWWMEQKQQLINARLLSISTGWFIFSLTKTHSRTHAHLLYNLQMSIMSHYNMFCR